MKITKSSFFLHGLCLLSLLTLEASAITKIWTPQVVRPAANNPNNANAWNNANNWTPVGVPTNADDVIIPSGSNTCYIDAILLFTPTCKSLTIQSDAAVYNRSSLADIGGALTIVEDLIIGGGGYFFSEAKITIIGRDLWIQPGGGDGSLIVMENTNEIRIGRNFINEGTLAKRKITATFLNIRFDTNQNGFIYANSNHNNTKNTFVREDLSTRAGFNFGYLINATTPYNIFKTGAFDNVVVSKDEATLQNSGPYIGIFPALSPNTTGVLLPFMAGIVGDGVNDFDGIGGVDGLDVLYSISNGVFEIQQGSVIVNNVTGLTSQSVTVYDGSTTHPQSGLNWEIPPADINIRNDLIISDANFGLGSYNGASLDLYTAATKSDICLHLGGSLEDRNKVEPSQTAGQRRGLYIGPVDQIFNATSYQDRPYIVFNGNDGQDLNALCENIRDYNNIANQGRGMVLPNVIIKKPSAERVTIGSGTNIRILGNLTIFSGELNINGRKLLFGDSYADEINVMAVGNPANASPDAFGTLRLNLGGKLLLSTINDGAVNTGLAANNDTGAFLRGRRGSSVILEGTAATPVELTRDSPPGGRVRVAFYSGARLRARYCNFSFPSSRNDNYAITTNFATDNATGGTGSNGGLKIYEGVILYNYTTNLFDPAPAAASLTAIHSLSNCLLAGSKATTIVTINTEGFYRFENTQFNDDFNDNKSCASQKTEGQLLFIASTGTAGGRLGELKDIGTAEGTGTGVFPADRINWDLPPQAIWRGDNDGTNDNSWNDPKNWIIPDQTGGCNCGPAYNPDNLVPGVTITNIDVALPRRSISTTCVSDINITINGSIIMESEPIATLTNTPVSSHPELTAIAGFRTWTINPSITVNVKKDIIVYWGNTFSMGANAQLNLEGNFLAGLCKNPTSTALLSASIISIANGASIHLVGTENQQVTIRHNPIKNFVIDKPTGTALLQGVCYDTKPTTGESGDGASWTFRVEGNLQIKRGTLRILSDTRLDIARDYIQENGVFDPLNSQITLRGNYNAIGGSMNAGGSSFRFHPIAKANTPSGTQVNWNIITTANHVFNDVEFSNSTAIQTRTGFGTAITGITETNTDRVTYTLQSPIWRVLGTMTLKDNRTVVIAGKQLLTKNLTLEGTAQFDLNSTTTAQGELYFASGGGLTVGADARFNMIGLPTQYIKISRSDVLGTYGFTINGTVSARYYIAEYMNDNGIYLTSTAKSVSPGIISVGGGGKNYTSPALTFTNIDGGSGVAATPIVSGTPLTFIAVTNGGSGYTTPPTVNFSSGSATATAVLTGSPIASVSLTNTGSGYTSTPTITVDNTGTGGSGLAVNPIMQPSEVIGFTAVSGTNYTKPPLVIIGGPGSGASARAVLSPSSLQLQTLTMSSTGSGYTNGVFSGASYVNIEGSGGSGSGAIGQMTVVGGQVTQVEITNGGSGYLYPIEITIVGGGGTGAVVNVSNLTVNATTLANVEVLAGGTGYTSAPIISFDNTGAGGTDAVATAVVSSGGGTVVGLEIVSAGSGYLSAPTLTFTGGSPTTPAAATAATSGGRVTAINITTNDNYTTLPTVTLTGGGGTGAIAEVFGDGGTITGFTLGSGGSGYRTAPLVSIIGSGTGASARAKLNPSAVTEINVLNGGSGYSSTPTIVLKTANGDGTPTFTIPSGDIVMTGTAPNMVVDAINVPVGGYGAGYTTAPYVEISGGGGSGAALRPLLNASAVVSIGITPELKYPVASFSDGIFTNTAYGATAAAMTIDGNYSTYRTKANTNTDPDNLVGGLSPVAAGVTVAMHDYGSATFGDKTGPRIDTIYNVVFAKNPAVDVSGDYTLSNNIRRVGTNNDPTHRIVFKDALGTFSGEDFDGEEAITTVPAGTVDILITPDPINTDTKLNNEEGMIVWRDPNVKRWDGGPAGTGTNWSDPENWRPNGIPVDIHDVVIDYSLMWVDYGTNPPTLKVPRLNINMDHDYTSLSTTAGKSLTINSRILPRIAGGTSVVEPIELNIGLNFRIGGTVAIGEQSTIEVTNANALIEVGENWSNNGIFLNGNGTVSFYKTASRTISNILSTKNADQDLMDADLNAFNNVIFDKGNTGLSTDISVKGNLFITQGATFNASNRYMYLQGDWINRGTFNPANSTLYLRGNKIKRIMKLPTPMPTDIRSIKEDFFNLVIKTPTNVKLENRVEVLDGGTFTLYTGRVLSYPDREMIISEFASIAGPPSENSFVQGPAGRVFSSSSVKTTLAFPIGSEEGGKNSAFQVQTINASGGVTALQITSAGEGYKVGDRILVGGTTGTGAEISVATINGTGGVVSFTYTQAGKGYAVGDPAEVLKGQGTPVYVGNSQGSLSLQNMNLTNNRKTMFVAEQIETPAPGSRILPSSSPVNYISKERHWTIRNLPYVESGDIALANNADLDSTQVALWFDAGDEIIEGIPASTIVPISQLQEGRVMMDSQAPYSLSSATTAGYNDPTSTTEHNQRLLRGRAYQSSYWKDTQGGDNIDNLAKEIISGYIDSLHDGTFVLGFNYLLLPLEIVELTAKQIGEDVWVQWLTLNEQEAKHFIVERSNNGQTFEKIGQVEAVGNISSGTFQSYDFIDQEPYQGWNYYRLQQVEKTGKINTSPTVSVRITNEGTLLVYPNPLPKNALLNIQLPENLQAESVAISFMDMQGKVIFETHLSPETLAEGIQLNDNFLTGMYILRIQTAEKTYETKLVVQ